MVMDDQCQFHRDAKHTMREYEQLKRALGHHLPPRIPGATAMTTAMVVNTLKIVTVDLIDEITEIVDPILAMTMGIDVIIAATTAAMTDATTTVATTASTSVTEAIVVMITMMTVTMIGVMIDVARTITTAQTTTVRSGHLRHHPKGQPQRCIPEGQPLDQLHRRRSPSDQNQPANSIERQRNRARQH
jgi:hypothetical protein